jgi:glutathione S-transferase
MKLFYSANSPFVRKVMACAIARGIDQQIERLPTNPHDSPAGLLAANPLSKVPCLIGDDGAAVFDSPVICEFLDSVGSAAPLFPAPGPARWQALTLQALADGILDAALIRRGLAGKASDAVRQAVTTRQKATMDRALDVLERAVPHQELDIGTIAAACALGYLDLRFAGDDWRAGRPHLAAWFAAIGKAPALARTAPPGDG